MARTNTLQKPKPTAVARRRAAKKRAAFVATLDRRMVMGVDGNLRPNSHPREEIHFMTHLRHVRAERLAQAKADMARHTFKESLSEADLDELDDYEVDDDWDDELDQPLFDEEEIDSDEWDDLFANWDADLEDMFPEDLQPVDDHDPVYGDRHIHTEDIDDQGSYGSYRGVYFLGQGYGLDAVFGEGYRGGNCGFSVTTHP